MIKHLLTSFMVAAAVLSADAEKLVLLHTNDTHSQIDPTADGLGGVERRKALIDSVRAAEPNVILIDAGDIVQGTLFFNLYKGEVEEMVMNALGYDLRILGNHEFDNGIEALAHNLENADATLLAANYQMRGTPLESLFEPYALHEIDGKRIAFMPVNLDPRGMISTGNYTGMGYIDAIEAANQMAWYLKHIIQADMVVALTHIGYTNNDQPSDVQLVKSSKDIDLVIGGHSHTTIDPANPSTSPYKIKNAEGRDILVAQTGRYGTNVGEITIDLDDISAFPAYRLVSVDSRWDDRLDPALGALIDPYRTEVQLLNHNKIAKTAKYIDKASPDMLNFAADFVYDRARSMTNDVDLAIVNKGGLRNSLPKGDVSEGDFITLMPFFNRIVVIEISGADLRDAFDVMARANGNGVSAAVDATYDPATDKCIDIKVSGKALDPERTYRVATIDYLANGGDYMWPLTRGKRVATSDGYMYEDLLNHYRGAKGKAAKISTTDKVRMHPVR